MLIRDDSFRFRTSRRPNELLGSASIRASGAAPEQDAQRADGPGDHHRDRRGDLRRGHRQSGTSSRRAAAEQSWRQLCLDRSRWPRGQRRAHGNARHQDAGVCRCGRDQEPGFADQERFAERGRSGPGDLRQSELAHLLSRSFAGIFRDQALVRGSGRRIFAGRCGSSRGCLRARPHRARPVVWRRRSGRQSDSRK